MMPSPAGMNDLQNGFGGTGADNPAQNPNLQGSAPGQNGSDQAAVGFSGNQPAPGGKSGMSNIMNGLASYNYYPPGPQARLCTDRSCAVFVFSGGDTAG